MWAPDLANLHTYGAEQDRMSWIDDFWALVYDYRQYAGLLFVFLLFMLLLTVLSLALGRPGTASYTLSLVNLVLILLFGLLGGALFWYSHRRRANY